MALGKNDSALTIAELEKILVTRRRKLTALQKERARIQKKLEEIDRKIATLSGETGSRAHNAMSLVATLETILRNAGKPLPVSEILSKVHSSGYRSRSANFRALVNQTLIKEDRFASAGRGIYRLKK